MLNNIFLISFDLFDFEHNQIEGDFLQKRAVSEGVFKKCSLKQQISVNQLQRSNTCSNCFFSYSCNKLYKKQANNVFFQNLTFSELNLIKKSPDKKLGQS